MSDPSPMFGLPVAGRRWLQSKVTDSTNHQAVHVEAREPREVPGVLSGGGLHVHALLETLPAGAYLCDLTGLITYFNRQAVKLWGRTPKLNDPADRFCGSFRLFAADGSVLRHDQCWMALALQTGEDYCGQEIIIEQPDGRRLNVLAHANPIRDSQGKILGAVNILVDISQQKNAESALREADQRKDRFLALLAHELRNPLAPISNAVQIMKAEGPNGSHHQWSLDVIEGQVRLLVRLVDDLLDLSRVTRGMVRLAIEQVELREIVDQAMESSRPLIEEHGHELTVSLPNEQVFLEADPARLSQVLCNLLNNAAKYTERGGRIWLSAEVVPVEQGTHSEFHRQSGERELAILVRDNGMGISAEMLPRIFDLFTQASQSLDRSEGGLGIGLTLVKHLVEMHKGKVTARSEGLGKGSAFEIRLPLAGNPQMHSMDEAKQPTRPIAVAPRRILLVDDNRQSARSLAVLLRAMGHEVTVATNGITALEEASKLHPDVMLLDIGLPGLDGYEVARRLKQDSQFANTLLIAISGYGTEEDRRRSQAVGFNAHLIKPVDIPALRAVLAHPERLAPRQGESSSAHHRQCQSR